MKKVKVPAHVDRCQVASGSGLDNGANGSYKWSYQ
jgi:hypothetical protein